MEETEAWSNVGTRNVDTTTTIVFHTMHGRYFIKCSKGAYAEEVGVLIVPRTCAPELLVPESSSQKMWSDFPQFETPFYATPTAQGL